MVYPSYSSLEELGETRAVARAGRAVMHQLQHREPSAASGSEAVPNGSNAAVCIFALQYLDISALKSLVLYYTRSIDEWRMTLDLHFIKRENIPHRSALLVPTPAQLVAPSLCPSARRTTRARVQQSPKLSPAFTNHNLSELRVVGSWNRAFFDKAECIV